MSAAAGEAEANMSFCLKRTGLYHYPFFDNRQIILYMIKLTNIPSHLHDETFDFIRTQNRNNRFYLWSGKLIKAINKSLLIINL